MGSSPPQTPVVDPGGASAGQAAATLGLGESAQAGSQVNQIGPTGALTYYQTGVGPNGVPTYTAVQQLTPQQQELLNLQQMNMGIAGGAGGNMLANSFNMYSQDPTQVIGNQTSGIEGGLMGEWLTSQAPWMQLSHDQLDTQLRNQGLMPGSQAYNNAMNQLNQSQMMGVAGAASQFQPTAFQEAQNLYGLPANLGMALSSFNQPGNVNLPETGQAPGYAAPNVLSAISTAQQGNEFNTGLQQQQNMANLAGLLSIGKGFFGV